jgi:serine/threonine-protein kinase HipA
MRQGKVFYQNHFAGVVTETNDGDYTFEYDNDYIQKFPYQFITFSMPVSEKLYRENRLFPFLKD